MQHTDLVPAPVLTADLLAAAVTAAVTAAYPAARRAAARAFRAFEYEVHAAVLGAVSLRTFLTLPSPCMTPGSSARRKAYHERFAQFTHAERIACDNEIFDDLQAGNGKKAPPVTVEMARELVAPVAARHGVAELSDENLVRLVNCRPMLPSLAQDCATVLATVARLGSGCTRRRVAQSLPGVQAWAERRSCDGTSRLDRALGALVALGRLTITNGPRLSEIVELVEVEDLDD